MNKIIIYLYKLLFREYTVKYLVSFGCMTINEEEYKCIACCKYYAYLMFIEDTKNDNNHYSARENRTPLTYDLWKDDISS